MFVELFPESLSPLFLSVMQHLIGEMLDFVLNLWGFRPPQDIEPVGVFYNQPYFNRSYIETALAPLPASVRERVLGQLMNPFGHMERSVEGGFSLAYFEMMVRMLRIMYRFPERLADIISNYQSEIAELQSLPIESASDEELVTRIREKVFGASSILLGYDFLLIAITRTSYQVLGSFLERFAGEDTEILRARLISGVDGNMTMETNLRLWDLAETAKHEPEVVQALKRVSTPGSGTTFAELPGDSEFVVEFDKFLQVYGHREIRMDIMYPTWVEDPTPVLGFIRGYLGADSSQDPHLRQEDLRRDRIEAMKEVSDQLSQKWVSRWFIKPIFFWVLRYAQALTRERDTMHFEMTRVFPLFRSYLHELGRRWVDDGWIDHKEDVFFLTFDELEKNAFEPSDRRKLVQTHKEEYEISQSTPWPDAIIGEREIFLREGPPSAGEEGELSGIASSPGMVSGVARLIRGPDDFNNLQDGDILVAPFTTPVWTPLFGIAGGVVTESGGILSHGAIVAREYGIPAVMSVANVMNLLEDGSQIVVDGDRGFVRVI
jgi:pyruvate,water dikinase